MPINLFRRARAEIWWALGDVLWFVSGWIELLSSAAKDRGHRVLDKACRSYERRQARREEGDGHG